LQQLINVLGWLEGKILCTRFKILFLLPYIKGECEMSYTIEINKVINGEHAEFVVGCEFAGGRKANHTFQEIENKYSVEPNYKDDYLVDFYDDGDIISTFATNEANAYLIDELHFKK
jgi:hypothetical protein